ncbi:MAG TPA: MarR family transcriptional regulator [Solirubrobacteraceae bacterium]|jgi:DNA-binding MarR family transcriptional regulator|nr:MarR family transcriptional regulator [Solirubrobacteraceae bacterium]
MSEPIRHALNRKDLAAARQRSALARLLGLADADVLAIQYLAVAGRLTASRLGSLLQMTSGGSTALVQRLEREGCIVREPHPVDRRSSLLRLTPGIEHRAGAKLAPLVASIDAASAELSAAEREVVGRFLERVAEEGERHADELARQATAAVPAAGSPVPGLWA